MTHSSSSRPASRSARVRAYSRVAATLAVVGALVAASAAGCGQEDGVVGGDCAAGYTQCDLTCVDTQSDPNNCGGCNIKCPAGVACIEGYCGAILRDGAMVPDAHYEDGRPYSFDSPYATCDGNSTGPECRPHPRDGSQGDGNGNEDGTTDGNPNGGDGSGEEGNPSHGDGSGGDGMSSTGDGSSGDGSKGDGSSGDGSSGDGSSGDGSAHDSGNLDATYPDGCVPPFDTAANCGTCGNTCTDPNGVCELVDGGFQCGPTCTPPLTDCNGACVNLARDPRNCGQCGKVCPSQYCFLATCQGSVAGSIMIIGHDFASTSYGDEQGILLTNSVFYNSGAVNLLSFEEYGNASTVANGLTILHEYASAKNITLTVTPTNSDSSLTNDALLVSQTAVIVWDQPNAPSGTLGSFGTEWAPHLSAYVQGGGIVIVLNGGTGIAQMPALITNAALLNVTGQSTVAAGTGADVPSAGFGIGVGMTTAYQVEANTSFFTTSESAGTAAGVTTFFVANVQGQATELLAVQKVIN